MLRIWGVHRPVNVTPISTIDSEYNVFIPPSQFPGAGEAAVV
jgi:hypothetical protein